MLAIILSIGAPEIIIIVLAVLLIFGGKKIPELMKGLGKGLKEFKNAASDSEIGKEINGIKEDINSATKSN